MIDRQRLAELAAKAAKPDGAYVNCYPTPEHGLSDFLRWQWQSRGQFPKHQRFVLHKPDPTLLAAPAPAPRLTWIGHSTFLLQYRHWNVLTDPVFSERCSPVQFAGPKRAVPPALDIEALPPINAVLVSHNHYDHLDRASVKQLHTRFGDQIVWYVPSGVAQWLHQLGIRNIRELGWWQSVEEGECEAFCLPAQHFSGRGINDRNRSLWCSWRVHFGDFSCYFAGDTGYAAPLFQDIGALFGAVDLALLPIGAYEPRWFMSPVHINPAEAVAIHQDIHARQSVAMHWGTFVLTDEPMDAPPRALAEARRNSGLTDECFRVLEHGDVFIIDEKITQSHE